MPRVPLHSPARRGTPSSADELRGVMRTWQWRLLRAELTHAALRGGCAALLTSALLIGLSWLTPVAEDAARGPAVACGGLVWLTVLVRACWPLSSARAATALDERLELFDRLATAWSGRRDSQSTVVLQRRDAVQQLRARLRSHRPAIAWHIEAREVAAVAVCVILAGAALSVVSPRRSMLEVQAADEAAAQREALRLAVVRDNTAALSERLTPEVAQQIQAILDEAANQLQSARSQREATTILARAEARLNGTLADPAAQSRDEALAAISEALASEPLTRALAEALQHEDVAAAHQALSALDGGADTLSEAQRQDVGRALQRAANVGHGEAAAAATLKQAAAAFGRQDAAPPGDPVSGQVNTSLSAVDRALNEALEASRTQAGLSAAIQGLHDSGDDRPLSARLPPGGGRDTTAADTSSRTPATGAGVNPAVLGEAATSVQPPAAAASASANTIVIAGRSGGPPVQSAPVEETFQVRGAPRPYREVLAEYAPSQRDYIERADIPPAARDLVRQYFVDLDSGQ